MALTNSDASFQRNNHKQEYNTTDHSQQDISTDVIEISSSGSDSPDDTKPIPGSQAWHERRKENHKQVERKRREMINRAMDELSAVIPGNDKNKSKLLGRAVQHIKALGGEVRALRSQLDQYRLTEQRNKAEIDALNARLSSA